MNMNEVIPINWDKKLSHIIKVIGVGGGGNNAVKNMYEKGIEGVDFIICNTDLQALNKNPIPNKIQLGAKLTKGLGAGCKPEIGREAALESLDEIRKVLETNTEMIFIATGLGGGTGTGASPVIAKEAKDMGILTVAIVTLPFEDEGEEPYKRAIKGLINLSENVDSLLIIKSEKLYEIYPDLSIFEAFPKADDIVAAAAKSIAEIITVEGYINVDFADVKMVMANSGMSLMGYGRAAGENRVEKAAEQALKSPLLNDIDIAGSKNILVNVSSGLKNPLKTAELRELMKYIKEASKGSANFKRGVTKDESLDAESSDAEISVTIIATGFSMENAYVDIYDDIQSLRKQKEGQRKPDDEPKIYTITSDIPYPDEIEDGVEVDLITDITNEVSKPVDFEREQLGSAPANRLSQSANASTVNTWGEMQEKEIAEIEKIPAFQRANTKIVTGKNVVKKEVSMYRLDESDGNHSLGENNSFLDRDVD
jgi:cell division protein FtsZ